MSTRKYLKDRKKYFEFALRKNPNDISAIKVIKEIDFILIKLKTEYDNIKLNPSQV